ncbi:hypothetical protein [Stenotrophomonas sp. AR029]|uniref:hypothetical protein n=1 Tax=Stenotrophomonas sp. AR029 TaxID=3398601 RepID=UPI0039C607EA
MPYNILLLPLLAGYFFLAKSRLRTYSTARLPKDQLLLSAALVGFFLLLSSRLVCLVSLRTELGHRVAVALHEVAPFPYIGTALGTLAIAAVLVWAGNLFVTEKVAGYWLYHRRELDPLTRVLWGSIVGAAPKTPPGGLALTLILARAMFGVLRDAASTQGWRLYFLETPWREFPSIFEALRDRAVELSGMDHGVPRTIMINLKDGKVMVGYTVDLPTNKHDSEFATVSPIWTGVRNSEGRVKKIIDYKKSLTQDKDDVDGAKDPKDFSRVIRTSEILSVSFYSPDAFVIDEAEEKVEEELGGEVSIRPSGEGYLSRFVNFLTGR